jgi:hypothetical protein
MAKSLCAIKEELTGGILLRRPLRTWAGVAECESGGCRDAAAGHVRPAPVSLHPCGGES